MKQHFTLTKLALAITLLAFPAIPGFSRDKNPSNKIPPAAKSAAVIADDVVSSLPASDAIAVIDVARLMSELLPQIRAISPETAGKVEKEINDFIGETGIDLYKIKSATIGLNMAGKTTNGAALIEGASFDPQRLKAALTKDKKEIKAIEYKGKQIYVVSSKEVSKAGAKVGVGVEEDMAFSQIAADRVAAGTLSGVKAVLDGGSGTANSALSAILNKTNSGLVRFAVNLPESAKEGLAGQGDLFKQLSTIKTIFGSFDLTSELSAVLDAKMRTATSDEAAKLQTSLAGLVGMGKMFLGGNNDPQMQLLNEVLDMIRIGAQDTDVSLSLTVPRKVFETMAESGKKKKTEK